MGLKKEDLSHFTGSETFTRHSLMRSIVMTEGAMHVAEHGGAHWLMDMIASNQLDPKFKAEEFQVWKLTVTGSKGKLVVTDGNHNVIYEEDVPFTDFPLPEIELWYANRTIYLPSEH